MNNENNQLSQNVVSGKSIFFSKYFPGCDKDRSNPTHLHWKKVISGMNLNDCGPEADHSSYNSTQSMGSALLEDILLSSSSNTNGPSAPASRNHYAGVVSTGVNSVKVDSHGHVNTDPRDPSTDIPWRQSGELPPGRAVNSEMSRSSDSHIYPAAFAQSRAGFSGLPEGAVTSTTVNNCQTFVSFSREQQMPHPDSDSQKTFSSPASCSSTDTHKTDRTDGTGSSADCSMAQEEMLMESPHSTSMLSRRRSCLDSNLCQVCEDVAAGFYCGAFVCEACKKFFIRASKQEKQRYVCLRQSSCKITKESRVQCQYCRFQKCLKLKMYYPGEGKRSVSPTHVSGIPCGVCNSPSSGFHFGALTCEGCKGFFRRMVKEREVGMYKCSTGGVCEISAQTRNMCKACRYKKCINIGMSVEGSRIGRQPNAVKHAISLEVKKQRMEQPLELQAAAGRPLVTLHTPSKRGRKEKRRAENVRMDLSIRGNGGDMWSDVCPPPASVSVPPGSKNGLFVGHMGVKEEVDSDLILGDVELTEVQPEAVVKQEPEPELELEPEPEPEPDRSEEMDLMSNLEVAGKELVHMCAVDRAKRSNFDPSEFETYPTMWKKQMRHFNFHAQCCIRFSKKVPGFRDLLLDDQVALVQNSIYPVVVLNHARNYELDTDFFNFFNFNKVEEKKILSMCAEFVTLQSHFQHMGIMAQTMQMTDMEYTLLSCLLLFDAECAGLQNQSQVIILQDRFMHILENYEIKTHPSGLSRFGELMLRIGELTLASVQHFQTMSSFLSRHSELTVPQLYKEMFFDQH